jgi:hypothetical protein
MTLHLFTEDPHVAFCGKTYKKPQLGAIFPAAVTCPNCYKVGRYVVLPDLTKVYGAKKKAQEMYNKGLENLILQAKRRAEARQLKRGGDPTTETKEADPPKSKKEPKQKPAKGLISAERKSLENEAAFIREKLAEVQQKRELREESKRLTEEIAQLQKRQGRLMSEGMNPTTDKLCALADTQISKNLKRIAEIQATPGIDYTPATGRWEERLEIIERELGKE